MVRSQTHFGTLSIEIALISLPSLELLGCPNEGILSSVETEDYRL
tara:strand:- start:51 stop:185 length:135 start_codon:yes stop_codon:yes gene_type:complete